MLACGLLIWMKLISPENVIGAFLISQITLLLLLVPRFWQRGVAVAYWQRHMLVPITPTIPVEPVIPIPVAPSPVSPPSVGPGEPTLA